MGICSYVAIQTNTFVVFSFVIIWTAKLLLVPSENNVHCGCESPSQEHCRFLMYLCMNSMLQVVRPSPSLTWVNHTQFVKGSSPPIPVSLISYVVEDTNGSTEAPLSYFHLLFPLYMVLHLSVVLFQCWSLKVSPELTRYVEKVNQFNTIKDENVRWNEIMSWIQNEEGGRSRRRDGLEIFIRELIGYSLVVLQMIMIQIYVKECEVGKLFDWLSPSIQEGDIFMYNELPRMANCRLNGSADEMQFIFKEPDQELNLTCYLYSNDYNRLFYGGFYAWTCLFLLILSYRVVKKIIFVSFTPVRTKVLKRWTRGHDHPFCEKTTAKIVSPFHLLFILEARSTVTVSWQGFIESAQGFLETACKIATRRTN